MKEQNMQLQDLKKQISHWDEKEIATEKDKKELRSLSEAQAA
jgi:hypothetical protein